MSGRNDNAFDRQLEREIDRLAGPEPSFDVREVVEQAAAPRRRRPSFFGGNVFVPVALAVVLVAFGVALAMSGLLDSDQQSTDLGASPSPSAETRSMEDEQGRAAVKVDYATGRFQEPALDGEAIDGLTESGEVPEFGQLENAPPGVFYDLPLAFDVTSSDPRLVGEAIVLLVHGEFDHEVTAEDFDEPRPNGLWRLESSHGVMDIRNAGGWWEGTLGPTFRASGEDPVDGIPNNAPGFDGPVPAILIGHGGYDGLTAYLSVPEAAGGQLEEALAGGDFEAVIVNQAPIGHPTPRDMASARAWIEAARDAGAIE
jgi:hypothetical protein